MCRSGKKAALNVINILAVSLVFIAVTCTFSLIDMPSYAADGEKAIQLVNNGAVAGIQGKQKSNVYFGNYQQSKDQEGRYKVEPIKWRVLQNTDGKVFLMADKLLDERFFDDTRYRTWDGSDVRAWLNGYGVHSGIGFINKALSSDEEESVAITDVETPNNTQYGTYGGANTSDKIFLLSVPEVTNPDSGFNSDREVKDDARKGTFTDYAASLPMANNECIWTLRTKGQDPQLQVTVRGDGSITSLGGIGIGNSSDFASYPKPIRPALKIDLGSVLFTSAAVNGKQSGNLGPDAMKAAGTYDGNDWKLTVKGAKRGFRITQTEAECRINDTLTLNYTGAVKGENEYISAMILNQAGDVLFYGRVAKPESASGTVDITVPKSISTGTYDLKVFNEQYNGDMKTDYASEMSNVSLTVNDPLVPYVNDAGRKQEPEVCTPVREKIMQTLSTGWYVILEDVSTTIAVNGNVDLILCDGVTLNALEGIKINKDSSLTIWAQSMGDDKGTLDASLKNYSFTSSDSLAGIGFDSNATGKLTINGGNIIAKGAGGAAGIGGRKSQPGGNVVINGGKVIAQATTGLSSYPNNQAIGHGAGYPSASAGTIDFGKVKVSQDGGSSYVNSSNRVTTCRYPNFEILIERCSDHKFENDVCKYCGAGRPLRIDDESNDLEVTLEPLTYNGKEQTQTVTKITLNGEDITDFCDISDNRQKDAGDYELTIKADPECGYEGTVKEKFTIKKMVPSFTVSADEVNDDLSISAAVLERSSEEIPGTLALTETTLVYGTNTYNWTFTPEDQKNYETVSGTVQIKVLGHKWKFDGFVWTGNEKDGYTSVMVKYVCENNAGHNDTVSEVTLSDKEIKPTCTEGGKTVYTAAVSETDSLDGKEHTESKDAKATVKLGHSFTNYISNNDATCTEDGTRTAKCDRCDETDTQPDTGSAKGHQWKAATCDEPKTCEVCQATEGEALGHAWGDWTPLDENQHQRVCGNDSSHRDIKDHEWDEGVVTREATSKEPGERLFTCGVCGATRTEVIPVDDTPVDPDIPVIDTAELKTVGNFARKEMKIFFHADTAVTNYQIQYRMAGETDWKIGWSEGTDSYTFRGLDKSSLCEFRIAGFVELEDGSWVRGEWSDISYRYMRAVKLKSAKAGKKSIKLTWTKDKKGNGYQIKYFTDKNIHMADADTVTIKGKKKTKCTIRHLKKGQTYYVRIRPIKIKGGIEYIGILKNTKKARIK